MANVNGGLVANNSNQVARSPQTTVKSILANVDYKKRFEEILGKKAQGFISSVINISNSVGLKDCEPKSIVSAAVVAATLDLPIDPNLGFAYIVPYNDKNKGKIAQFQMGYKGFIQLAQRSGQYKTINAIEVYEHEIKKVNRLTGEIELEDNPEPSTKVVGYIAYFSLLNGFEKALYMTREQLEAHGKKYSQSYKSNKDWVVKASLWNTDFDSMATKTVIKLLLSKYGPLSIEMQKAVTMDQAYVKEDVLKSNSDIDGSSAEYIDNSENNENIVDAEYQETPNKEQKDIYDGSPFQEE
ncbi:MULTISPECIES: recombinase RecT [unclassified Clostridium]|uniref:recombinase RecT n=1 Tax=unclassified Clostridium TaxID=2614128 RepID=UPI0002983763|nr:MULTISPECIES: recombinase RecT [unclassified Clostridium]EKQ56316.1 MAG: recombinase, phage RecT family [Clostridium sp. Maddingley MBC34-26]